MNKSFFWILAVVFALLQTSRAGDAFRISIIKGDAEPKLDKNQIEQFTKAGVASPDELPIIVCPQGKPDKDKPDPASTFQVVIENTQGIATAITMLGSDWYDCLSFKLVDDNGNSYSIQRWKDGGWFANAPGTRKWDANGKQVFPVCFFERDWVSYKGSVEQAKKAWPAPKQAVIAHLTVTFRYYPDMKSMRKWIEVSSKATDVILMAK